MSTFHGLPAHVLLVHAVVVLMPLCGLLLALSSLWPAARRRLAAPNAVLGVSLLALVPITTSAGEWLQAHVEADPLVRRHAELGDTAIWFAVPLAVLSVLMWWRNREIEGGATRLLAPTSQVLAAALAAACVVAGGAATYDIYRIGDSGAKAAWHDGFSASSSE